MTTLTGKTPRNTYKNLLQVSNANAGIDGTLRPVEDGEGTQSPLQLSSDAVNIASGFRVGGDTVTEAGTDLMTAADAAAQRTALGLGTAALADTDSSYVTTMRTTNTGTQNATALAADISLAAGRLIVVPAGNYTLNAVSVSSSTVRLRMMPGARLRPDGSGGLYRSGTMLQFTNCTVELDGFYADGLNNGSPICYRQDNGTLTARNVTVVNFGPKAGLPSTVGVYGFFLKGVTDARIDGWTSSGLNDVRDGVYANAAGTVRHLFFYNCGRYHLTNAHLTSGDEGFGDDNDLIQFLDDRTPVSMNGTIDNVTMRYNGSQRRCLKYQGGYHFAEHIDIRKDTTFVPVSGSTDVGDNTLNCIDWASGITGFLRLTDSYVDATGFPIGIANSGGTGGQVLCHNVRLIGSQLNYVRTSLETGASEDSPAIGFYTAAGDSGSGMDGCELSGWGKASTPQGCFNYFRNCTFDDPRDYVFETGNTGKTGFEFVNNRIITRTPGNLSANSRAARLNDVRNVRIYNNALIQSGNTTHATVFIGILSANATGFASGNTAPTSPSTTPVSVGTSAVIKTLDNNATGAVALSGVTVDAEWNFGGTYAFWNYLRKQSTVSATTLTVNQFACKEISFHTTSASAVTVTIPTSIPVGTRFHFFQRGAGQITFQGDGTMNVRNRQGHTKSAGQYARVDFEVVAANETVMSGDTAA